MNKNTITILWVEDNPTSDGINFSELKARESFFFHNTDIEDNLKVPGIKLEDTVNGEILGNSYPNGLSEYHKYFNLKILQHPEEIKEYTSICSAVEDLISPHNLGLVDGAVPEIIAFDYKLIEGVQINSETAIKYKSDYKPLREFYNPNFAIIEKYGKSIAKQNPYFENILKYTKKTFILSINDKTDDIDFEKWGEKDEREFSDDEIGLYAGVLLTKQFRNHVCIGIPVTANKSEKYLLNGHAKFYEWLNEYDLGTAFTRRSKGIKNWKVIICESVKQLRDRIKTQVASGKIQPDLTKLIKLSGREFPEFGDDKNRIFTFSSIYGTRHLPLDGLFIDIEVENRDTKIIEFAEELLNILAKSANTSRNSITEAIKITQILWDTLGSDDFQNRYKLSERFVNVFFHEALRFEAKRLLKMPHVAPKDLNEKDKQEIDAMFERRMKYYKTELMETAKYFSLSETDLIEAKNSIQQLIKNNKTGISSTSKIKDNIVTLKELVQGKDDEENLLQLVVLFASLKLFESYSNVIFQNQQLLGSSKRTARRTFLEKSPTKEELFYLLNPSADSPIVLPAHVYGLTPNSTLGSDFKRNIIDRFYVDYLSKKNIKITDNLDFSLISPGFKIICRSYSSHLTELPEWLSK